MHEDFTGRLRRSQEIEAPEMAVFVDDCRNIAIAPLTPPPEVNE
jgi:hypothetical protein